MTLAPRILWFVHVPVPAMLRVAGRGIRISGAHWTSELLQHVDAAQKIELAVATVFPGLKEERFVENGTMYYTAGQPARYPPFGMRRVDLERCQAIIEDFRPDLIHFHGSERFFGLVKATGRTRVPSVVSLQGVLGPYSRRRAFFGALSIAEILRSIRIAELPLGLGLPWQYADMRRGARREARILKSVEGLLGRTEWDRAWGRVLGPQANYYHVGEILRPSFRDHEWSIGSCRRQTLIYTNAGSPRRGTENVLAAVASLRGEFPLLRLRLAGTVSKRSGYGRFLLRRVRALGLEDCVDFLGALDESGILRELCAAHLFVMASYLENSPNSLAEAMSVGMPCVASFVGGIPSMVADGQTGLLYPVDDVPLLADQIRTILVNDELAVRLGEQAREVAAARHDPATVVRALFDAYGSILERPQSCKASDA